MGECVLRELRSYVLRVYRQQAGEVAGTVQEVQSGRIVPFQSMEELWQAVARASTAGGNRLRRYPTKRRPAGANPIKEDN